VAMEFLKADLSIAPGFSPEVKVPGKMGLQPRTPGSLLG